LFGLMMAMVFLTPPQAQAQVATREASRPFAAITGEWNRKLASIEEYVGELDRDPGRSDELRALADEVRASALAERARADRALTTLQRLIDALGPAPAQDAPAEDPEIAAQRAQYQQDITDYRGRVAQAELALARASALEEQISALFLERLITNLSVRYPSPLSPDTFSAALPEAGHVLTEMLATPTAWWRNLPEQKQRPGVILRSSAFLAIAIIAGWAVRYILLKRFGRDPRIQEPTFARRLIGAVAEGLARGIVPAAIVGMVLFRTSSEASMFAGPFGDVIALACQSIILFILATALPKAALSPEIPSWRLSNLSADNAASLARIIGFLATIFAVDLFFSRLGNTLSGVPAASVELKSVYALVFNIIEAVGLLAILQQRLWSGTAGLAEDDSEDEPTAGPADPKEPNHLWSALRLLAGLLVIAAILGTIAGYVNFGTYVVNSMLGTGVAGGLLYLLRGLLRDSIGIGLRSDFIAKQILVAPATRRLLKFWFRSALDLLVWIGALLLAAPIWSVPVVPLLQWLVEALTEFRVGNFTISITDIGLALLVFFVVLGLLRWMQRGLADRILPETRMDPGVQHSLVSGFGYLSFAIATMVAISIVGIDLSNLALIAGALSVGIGFGLQTVVNNFVSGLILLIERPIKVGDWVVVGDKEGTVKHIRVRATEIETFQRASVIIPNSELLSTAVVNWTHADRTGRMEIVIGVAYGSNTERVRELLLGVARENSEVSRWPAPYVRFKDFGDSALVFELRCYLYDIGQIITVSSDVRFAIDRVFRENNIEIPFPQRDVHVKQSEHPNEMPERPSETTTPDLKNPATGSKEE
jgi:small-conductance mechanosensitive channel